MDTQRRRHTLIVWSALIGLLLAWINAPEGDGLVAVRSLPVWLAHATAGLALAAVTTRWACGRASANSPGWVQIGAGGLLAAVLFSPLALGLELVAAKTGLIPSDDIWPSGPMMTAAGQALLQEFAALAPPFVVLWLVINTPGLVTTSTDAPAASDAGAATGAGDQAATTVPETAADPPTAPGLLDRLPKALGRDLVALKADTNYLHVFTAEGHVMVLYSLNRACEELGDRGLRVHRSFWVAREAVVQVRARGERLQCSLSNGMEVPVSRRRKGAVIEEFGRDFRRGPKTGLQEP